MNMERRCILLLTPVALAAASWLPNDVAADDLQQAKATQVVKAGKGVPSGAAAGPVALTEPVQKVVYDPIANRLEDPVEVDLQQEQTSPLITGFRQLPSTPYLNTAIQNQRRAVAGTGGPELASAVSASGAASIGAATPEQFLAAFSSVLVRFPQDEICDLVGTAVGLRPGLADRILLPP